MEQYIPKSALVAEIERRKNLCEKITLDLRNQENKDYYQGKAEAYKETIDLLDTLEVKEVDLEKEIDEHVIGMPISEFTHEAEVDEHWDWARKEFRHFFELGLKAQHDNWKVVDNANLPQADRNEIYCVFTRDRYVLAKVINHPKDEELLQWKCTEFPNHRYDMCEGDKYMQIVKTKKGEEV